MCDTGRHVCTSDPQVHQSPATPGRLSTHNSSSQLCSDLMGAAEEGSDAKFFQMWRTTKVPSTPLRINSTLRVYSTDSNTDILILFQPTDTGSHCSTIWVSVQIFPTIFRLMVQLPKIDNERPTYSALPS